MAIEVDILKVKNNRYLLKDHRIKDIDVEAVENSENPVTSGALYDTKEELESLIEQNVTDLEEALEETNHTVAANKAATDDKINEINSKISDNASSENKLIDKAYVDDEIARTVTNVSYSNKKLSKTINNVSSDIVDVASLKSDFELVKSDVGLGNVDNTSDINKPVSTAQATAIADAKKAGTDAQVDIDAHEARTDNPHYVTKVQVGLGNVDNTSDLNKPISSATQAALDTKVDKITGKGLSTNDYTDDEKTRVRTTEERVTTVEWKIPASASPQNQLADKAFVQSSISTASAAFRGTSETGLTEQQFLTWADTLTHDLNDYIYWNTNDSAGNTVFKKYKYNGTNWVFEYSLNNSSFTSDEWAAIQSGVTTALVNKLQNIEDTAQVNILEGVKVNGTDLEITNKKVNINLTGKADKVASAVAGHIATLDANGNLVDSGRNPSEFDIANRAFPVSWTTDGTIEDLITDINNDSSAIKGKAYLSTVSCSDLPGNMVQAEMLVEVMDEIPGIGKVLLFTITSSDTAPYHWEYTSAYGEPGTWRTFLIASDITGKADKVVNATNGHLASLDANGNLTDSGITPAEANGLVILSYGNSTWTDFTDAYNRNAVVYCKASSNSNPASGNQSRMAFMAYKTDNEVEFQYYRSVATHSNNQQGDQIFVYKLNSSSVWSVTTREAYTKVVAGSGLDSSYSNGTITLTANDKADKVSNAINGNFASLDVNGNLVDSGHKHSDYITSHQDITGKADKVSNSTSGNFAGLDSNGNLTDSGHKHSDYKTVQTAVSDPSINGTGTSFIDTIAQNENGEIIATKKYVQNASSSQGGLMSSAHYNKVESVETGSQVNVIDTIKVNGTTQTVTSKAVDITMPTKLTDLTNDGNFVRDADYVHTDNNFTDAEQTKLAGIATGSQVNVIETIKINGAAQSVVDKTVDLPAYPTTLPASDVYSWAKAENKPSYNFSEIGLKPTTVAGYGIVDAKIESGTITLGSETITPLTAHQDISGKVDKITGKGLSTEDYTTEEKTKLGTIEANAQINIIEDVKINGVSQTITNKSIDLPAYPITLPASDVSAWAKAANKPEYTFSEITSKPTTISGFGITDAYTKTEIDNTITGLQLGTASKKDVGTVTSNNTGLVTGGDVYSAINTALTAGVFLRGVSTAALTDGGTETAVIEGNNWTAHTGDLVIYNNLEFVWVTNKWVKLGDDSSYALKTTTITAGTGLTGGGDISANRTISLSSDTVASLAKADAALPSSSISQWALSATKPTYAYSEITGTPSIPTKTSDLVNDSGFITAAGTNSATLQVSDTSNKRINTSETTGSYIQFTGGINKITISDGTSSFDVSIDPNITVPVTSVVGSTGDVSTATIASALTTAGYALTDTNTWRPLGTTADTACAGNDSRLSDSRPASDVYSWAKASSKPSYEWSEIVSRPTTLSSFTNDVGYITSYTDTWRPITNSYSGDSETTSLSQYGANSLYNALVNGYASSAGSASTAGYATYASYISGTNDAASPGGALLRSGSGRNDSSPTGDTWLFWDELGGTSSPWGIRHDQGDNNIGFFGAGSETSYINLTTGKYYNNGLYHLGYGSSGYVFTTDGGVANIGSMSVNYASSAGSAPASDVYSWAKASTKPSYTASEVGALKNYGEDASRPNGTTFILPGGTNAVSMRSGGTSGADIGIFQLTDDNAFICNSSDNGYLFATFDTDRTNDFSDAAYASFAVLSDGAGATINGNTIIHAGNISSYAITSHQSLSGYATQSWVQQQGYLTSYTDTNTWRPITDTYTGSDTGTSVSQAGTNALYNALVNGYASSAGNADTIDSEHASAFAHVGQWNNLLTAGNEFNFISNGYSGAIWLNYQDGNRQSGANVTEYYFGNGASNYTPTLYCGGVYKYGYGSSSYVLTSDGGATAISGLSVSYASSAGSASSATSASYAGYLSVPYANGSDALDCLQKYFDSCPKSEAVAVRLQSGSHAMAYGWFLSGYGYNSAYGGWFISEYATPTWVGVSNGTWTYQNFITSANIGSQSVNYASSAGSAGSATNATNATYASYVGGLSVHDGRNYEANKIVRTDSSGYIQCGYINSSSGDEGNNSSPSRVWGTNGSDSYLRTYLTSALSVGYASSAGNADTLDGYHYNNLPYLTAHQDISGKVDKVSSSRPGVTKLYRNDSDDAYNVQINWTGSYWYLKGYYGDTYHAGVEVDYAVNAGYASSAGSAPASDVYSWAKASTKPSYSYSEISGTPSSLPASDVYSWAKASSKPSYDYSEITGTCSYASSSGYASSAGNADTVDSLHLVTLTQAQYDALSTKDSNTLYVITTT